MHRTKNWALITLISLTIVTISTAVAFAYNSRDEIITTISVGCGENALQYIKEPGTGEISGPESFSLKSDGGFYLLDTARKVVMSFNSSGGNDEIYKIPDDFTAAKISTGLNDQLYLLDTSKATIGIFDKKKILTKYQINNLITDALIDFGVTKAGLPYVVLFTETGAKSYLLNIENGKANVVETKEGRLISNGKFYKTTLIKEDDSEIGHSAKVSIYDSNNNLEEVIIKSNHWIEGACYLGEENNDIIVQTHEIESDADNNTCFEDLIKKVDKDGNIKAVAVLPKKYKYISNDTIYDGSSLYHLNTGENSIKLEKVDFILPNFYVSELESIRSSTPKTTSNSTDAPITIQSTLPWVNRSLIQSTAYSYWNRTWYCSQSNYNTTGGSIRPRYITAPNQNYQCVPYCWGGWDSLGNFQSRQESGWTCGNINTSGYYISGTCGVDCSGYVQRCWGISDQKYNTTMLDGSNISYRIPATSLKYGDAWNSSGHIMLYHQRDGYGNYILYEATKLNSYDRVAHTSRSVSSVEGSYHSIRRYNINEDV